MTIAMPRLLSRPSARPPAAARPTDTSLPPYEPPSCALDDKGRRAVSDLKGALIAHGSYEEELKKCAKALEDSVGDIHERLHDAEARLATIKAKRARQARDGDDPGQSEDEEQWTKHVKTLRGEVDALTVTSERAIRAIIDAQADFEDERTILQDLPVLLPTPTPRSRAPEGEEEGEEQEEQPQPSISSTLDQQRARKLAEYQRLDMYQRYAMNNTYAGFKKVWHDAAEGGDGRPLPDASRWFRNGEPVLGEENEDEDLVMERVVQSMNCPLTLRPMMEPYANRKCPHVFERKAIYEYLAGGATQCPTNCTQQFSARTFDRDFYLDTAMVRRIERSRQQGSDGEMEDEDDADVSLLETEARSTGTRAKRERVDVDEDEDE